MKIVVTPEHVSPSRFGVAVALAKKMSPSRKSMVISHDLGDLYFLKRLANGVVFVLVQWQEVYIPDGTFYNRADSLTYNFGVPTENNSVVLRDGRFSKMSVVDLQLTPTQFPPEPRGFRSVNAYKNGEFYFVGSTHGGYVNPFVGEIFTNSIASNNFGVVTDSVGSNPMFGDQPTNTVTEVWHEGQISNTTVVTSGPSLTTAIEIDQTTTYYLTASSNSKLGEGYGIAVQAHEYSYNDYGGPGSVSTANGSRTHTLVTKDGTMDLGLNSSNTYAAINNHPLPSTQTLSGTAVEILWSGYVDRDLLCIIVMTITYMGDVYRMNIKWGVLLFKKFEKVFEATLFEGNFIGSTSPVNTDNLPYFYSSGVISSVGAKTICGLFVAYRGAATPELLKDTVRLKRDGSSFSVDHALIGEEFSYPVLINDTGDVKSTLVTNESGLRKRVISDVGSSFNIRGFIYDSSGYMVETTATDWYPSSILSKL